MNRLATLSPLQSFLLLASITVSFLAGAVAPTPLYPQYQAQWGFTPLTITVIFGIYALAVLLALLFLGRLSDHVGRRPVLVAALAAQVVAMLLFASADGLALLLVARVVQGLSVGAALGAVGAGLLDVDKQRGALANALTPPIGTALGGIVAGVVVSLAPASTAFIYLLYAGFFLLQGVAMLWMRETFAPRRGALASLRPQFSFSPETRAPLLHGAPIIIAAWIVAGFYASLGPALLRNLTGGNSPLLSGFALFVMAGSGAATVLLLQRQTPHRVMRTGAVALALGSMLVIAALALHSAALFFAGLMVSGAGFGGGFQGAVRSILARVHANERAGVLSVIFVIAYLAMGLPAITAGYLLLQSGDLPGVVREFGIAIALLALFPIVAQRLSRATSS
ncbi:MAG: MFS transporter [Steroidobacteraceae bacterium]